MQLTIACTALALFVVKCARGKQLQRALCRNPTRPPPKQVNPFDIYHQYGGRLGDATSVEGTRVSCGSDFRGSLDTSSGSTCLRWDDEALKNQLGLDLIEEYPDSGLEDSNFCRNPDNDPNGPWCFTSVEGDGDYCAPACSPCGFGHRGSVSQTSTGATCLRWDDEALTNKLGINLLVEFPYSGLEDGNFCRNPDNDPNGPWCVTSVEGDGEFDYCDTGCPTCGSDFRGSLDTSLGSACLRWDDEALKSQLGRDFLEEYPDSGLEDGNFCRNPDNDPVGPWCFTSVQGEVDYCDVPECSFSTPVATRGRSLFPSAISKGLGKVKGRVRSAPIIALCTSSTADEAVSSNGAVAGFASGAVGVVATLLICTVLLAY